MKISVWGEGVAAEGLIYIDSIRNMLFPIRVFKTPRSYPHPSPCIPPNQLPSHFHPTSSVPAKPPHPSLMPFLSPFLLPSQNLISAPIPCFAAKLRIFPYLALSLSRSFPFPLSATTISFRLSPPFTPLLSLPNSPPFYTSFILPNFPLFPRLNL